MTAKPLAPVWQVLPRELLEDLRLLFGLPNYHILAEMDNLTDDEWRRLMQERPKTGRAGA